MAARSPHHLQPALLHLAYPRQATASTLLTRATYPSGAMRQHVDILLAFRRGSNLPLMCRALDNVVGTLRCPPAISAARRAVLMHIHDMMCTPSPPSLSQIHCSCWGQ